MSDEGCALVDLLKSVIEGAQDKPHFTVPEHALMAAGTLQREWLAEHDARVWDEGFAAGVNHDLGDWENIPELIQNPYREEQS